MAETTATPPPPCPLTAQQLRLVALAADGHRRHDMARALNTTCGSTDWQLRAAYTAADVPNTTALVARALRLGWIQ